MIMLLFTAIHFQREQIEHMSDNTKKTMDHRVGKVLPGSIAEELGIEPGDLLLSINGESVEDIAKSVAYLGVEKCLAGGDIVVMKHNQNAKYLSYALSTPDAIKQKGLGKTKLKVVHSNVPSIKSIVVPIPSLPEQERIAARLDAISEKVKALQANYDQTITLCNDLKQSLLKSIFA